ncbi:MAG: sulfatase [Planctomycetes bacterium]|nr:sulfatase [Planctomycetota bacterium]
MDPAPHAPSRVRRWSVPALLLVVLLAGLLYTSRSVQAGARRPNVIVITLDTLRADRLGCYGYPKGTTPELDRFAERATRFEHAYTPQGFTLTAHMSLSTSLYPSVHRVDPQHALPRTVKKLSQRLDEAGYRTIGIVDSVPWMAPEFGFDRGFDRYEQVEGGAREKNVLVEDVLAQPLEAPLYLKLHYFDPHSDDERKPYEATSEDAERFTSWYAGPYDGCSPSGKCGTQHLIEIQTTGMLPDPDVQRLISDQYDAGVRSMDRELGALFRRLEELGRFEDTWIVVTADHGELLFEHGTVLHGHFWDETLHVPLLVHAPGQTTSAVSDALVSLVDIAPTLLDVLGLAPMKPTQGTSFAPALRGQPMDARPPVELAADARTFGVQDARWKIFGMGEFHLYDRVNDPGETTNLWRTDAIEGSARTMREALREQRNEGARLRLHVGPPLAIGAASEETKNTLHGLGYDGGTGDER